ncbi:MAG TPA: 3'-5' exonuclease [Anaerolineales bacterium]|nr:3'-5' exonuclease [Anaerolineales bacterium]
MRYIITDLEATCWENVRAPERMEIIEIGAVALASATDPVTSTFARFVRPIAEPMLSAFCTQLTSITQADVDGAEIFSTVFPEYLAWIGPEPFTLCTWGFYDVNQFRVDCNRHGIAFPETFARHINLKQEFARVFNVRACGMTKALQIAKLPLEGTHHRGADDARNIAKLAGLILPKVEAGKRLIS